MICLCATTRRAARLLTQRYEEALGPANLTAAQFELIATLAQRRGVSQSTLAEALDLDQTTLSRNLKPLQVRGLLTQSPNPNDRRQKTYILTSAGNEALAEAMPLWQSAHKQMQGHLADRWGPTLSSLTQLTESARPTMHSQA